MENAGDNELIDHLRSIGAIKSGHFILASGRHSDNYVEKFDLLRQPRETEAAMRHLTKAFKDTAIHVVVGPTTGGVILAFEVGRQLGVKAAYAERKESGSGREFRRGTVFEPGSRVLVVDDILTTGGSIRETLAALEHHPVDVVAVAVLVDRSGGSVQFAPVPLVSLGSLNIATWEPDTCPLCAKGIPVVKPGTTLVA
jgi:orotate phosphoribosyltransferase